MPRTSLEKTQYFFCGVVERWVPSRRSYVWKNGYAYPGGLALTYREAQLDARLQGKQAEIVRTPHKGDYSKC